MVYFNEEQFSELKRKYSKEEIKTIITERLRSLNVPLPIFAPSIDDAIVDFNVLKSRTYVDNVVKGEWFSRYEYQYPKVNLYIDTVNDGLKASGHFTHEARMLCDGRVGPGPMKTWNSDKFIRSALGALFSLKLSEVSDKTLRICITMRKMVASQFKPAIAKCLYELFDVEDVLDFSMGWGDRLVGALATPNLKSYTGIDPNTETHKGYKKIIETFNIHNKKLDINISCAEDFDHEDRQYDFVFTSPPYYDCERYSYDNTQSWKRYKKLEDWNKNFLNKSIGNFWSNIKDNGIVAINISDVYSQGRNNYICDQMNDYISKLPKAKYVGCIGYKMAKRAQSNSDRDGIFCEPIWIFEKTTGSPLDINSLVKKNELGSFIEF
ncbi:MAG: hypothetical protein ACOC33_02005 [bacterium]